MGKYIYKRKTDTAEGKKTHRARPGNKISVTIAKKQTEVRAGKRPVSASWVATLVLAGLACWVVAACILAALVFLPGAGGAQAGAPQPQEAETYAPLEVFTLDSRPVIVLDAGHGGDTPFGYEAGAVSPTDGSIWESDITSAIVQRLTALLQRHEDEVRVVRSATEGTYATPLSRANVAIKERASLLLSLHLNAEEYPYYGRGFSCFPTPPGRVYHEESVRFSELLVERVRPTGLPVMGEDGIYYHYYVQLPSGGFYKEIVESALQTAPRDEESFAVVEYAGCPAVLVEQWFISSQADMALMYSDEGFDTMARCLYLAICDYFGFEPKTD